MANGAQVVTAAAGGAVIAIAAMAGIWAYLTRRRADQEGRIDSAVRDIVTGVRAVRRLQADGHTLTRQTSAPVVELRTKRHLRLMAQIRPQRCAPPGRADTSSPRRAR